MAGRDGGESTPCAKRHCCGYLFGVALMLWHSTTLGVDYTLWISSAPAYFADIINHSGTYLSDVNGSADLLDASTLAFSVAQSVWAAGQLLGCMACAPLPRLLGYRWTFLLLVFLSLFGNILYSVAGIVGNDGGKVLAWIAKAIDGFGDGSVALGLGYIPIAMFGDRKRMITAMINYRALMACGMMIGGILALGLENVAVPEASGRIFSGGDLVGWAQAVIFLPSLILGCCAYDNSKPPVKPGAKVCTPYFTQKSCFWLFLVFSYGLTGSLATYFLPVFPYYPADSTLPHYITYVTIGAFASGFVGALFNSAISIVQRCRSMNGLPLLRIACVVITIAMSLMYAGYRTMDSDAEYVTSGQMLFIVGICIYFLASTSLSAGMAPVFKEVIPKTSLSAMMPLYKICLDFGKIIGPLYSDWASTESSDVWSSRADIAFVPSLAMYALITLCIFSLGKYLSTPDFQVPGGRGPGHRGPGGGEAKKGEKPVVAKADDSGKLAEMTSFVGNSPRRAVTAINSYENQRGDREPAPPLSSTTSGSKEDLKLYNGSSMSFSQITDAKNIDSVKVSLVI